MINSVRTGLVLVLLAGLAGCAQWPAPERNAGGWFCKPDSAVRYRGRLPDGAVSARPAPPHGSCRRP